MIDEMIIAHLKVGDKKIQLKISGMSFTDNLESINTSYPKYWIIRTDDKNGYYCKNRTSESPPNSPWIACEIEKLVAIQYGRKPITIYPERVSLWKRIKGVLNFID